MRQYVWYCVAHNWIVFQTFMEDCFIAFEWAPEDMWEAKKMGFDNPLQEGYWIPLGEL